MGSPVRESIGDVLAGLAGNVQASRYAESARCKDDFFRFVDGKTGADQKSVGEALDRVDVFRRANVQTVALLGKPLVVRGAFLRGWDVRAAY